MCDPYDYEVSHIINMENPRVIRLVQEDVSLRTCFKLFREFFYNIPFVSESGHDFLDETNVWILSNIYMNDSHPYEDDVNAYITRNCVSCIHKVKFINKEFYDACSYKYSYKIILNDKSK